MLDALAMKNPFAFFAEQDAMTMKDHYASLACKFAYVFHAIAVCNLWRWQYVVAMACVMAPIMTAFAFVIWRCNWNCAFDVFCHVG